MGVETIDEFAQEVVDHDGGGVIEHRQMERDRNGIGFGTYDRGRFHRLAPARREGTPEASVTCRPKSAFSVSNDLLWVVVRLRTIGKLLFVVAKLRAAGKRRIAARFRA